MDTKLAFIGAGNLASRVAIELHNHGVNIVQVYSRTVSSAVTLSRLLGCPYVTQPELITPDADLYIISVSDMAMGDLLGKINFNHKLIAHTAGSIPLDALKQFSENYGIFYPLQTFSKYREVNFSTIPFCIEANTPENEQRLIDLAFKVTNDVRIVNSEQRKQIHLAAVFANNFTNHLYTIAAEILQQKGLPFDIIEPLIAETAAKIKDIAPRSAQTGPAIRNDENIIGEHLKMLDSDPKLKEIYRLLSESIHVSSKK